MIEQCALPCITDGIFCVTVGLQVDLQWKHDLAQGPANLWI